jgi:hypothetical protein
MLAERMIPKDIVRRANAYDMDVVIYRDQLRFVSRPTGRLMWAVKSDRVFLRLCEDGSSQTSELVHTPEKSL